MNVPVRTTSTTAIVSLVFGIICWIAIPFIGAIVAIICGHVARTEIRNSPPGSIEGDGMAIAGLILGYLHLALIAMFLLLVFTVLGGLAFFTHFFH
jgi:heme O synthase-like polyprenyltransferase